LERGELKMLEKTLELPCGARLGNRIAKAAMTEGLADRRGRATAAHERLYRRWSQGGAGLLISGNVMVDGRYLERPGNVVLEDESGLEALRRYAEAGTSAGNHLWMQINHPGRQTQRVIAARPVAPSEGPAVKVLGAFGRPRALEAGEIEEIIGRFARAAELAKAAGFTGVQVHSAHGYLSSQFLSPLTNRRTDGWGGPIEGRARFLLEVVRATRARVGPAFPISVKLNSADFQRGGFTEAESMRVVELLNAEGIDLLEISGGNYEAVAIFGLEDGQPNANGGPHAPPDAPAPSASTQAREAYFLEYARKVRAVARMPLMLTGGLRTRAAMEDILSSGAVDVIGIARPLAAEPELPRELLEGTVAGSRTRPIRLGGKTLTGLAEVGFYARNIARMGAGLEPSLGLGKAASAAWYLFGDMGKAVRWRVAARGGGRG
jgi:2,4-dienoyl-CoA reductase-like NADH-dependent reductase (Old Yellow Enzyme family)